MRQQIFYRKSLFPLSGLKISISWNFLKQKILPLQKEPVLWDKNVLTENRETASLHPHIDKSFGYKKFCKTQKCSPTKFLVLWDNKYPLQNRDIPFLDINNFDARNYWLLGVPHRILTARRDKKKFVENRDLHSLPLPQIIHEVFRYQNFSETEKCSPTKFFGTVRQQIFYRKSWHNPLRRNIFRHLKLGAN